MNMTDAPVVTPNYTAIKQKQQATWASGDYATVGTTLQIVGETLAEAADVRSGERVLDVAAGNGNATLAAARRFAEVTSTDYVPALLDKGRARAQAEGLAVRFLEAAGARASLELAGEEILTLIRGGTPADEIAVVVPSLDRVRSPLETAFGSLGIPYSYEGRLSLRVKHDHKSASARVRCRVSLNRAHA